MGGGNAQKTAMARAKNAAKASADKNAGGGAAGQKARTNTDALFTCKVTYKSFPKQQRKAAEQHVKDNCPGKTFEECFPDWK